MSWIYSVILCLVLKARSCQLQRVKETSEFSISVTTRIEAESGKCISIPFQFTVPTNKVTAPLTLILFKGEPQNKETFKFLYNVISEMKETLKISGLPHGEYEYGFKLEWGSNQTYIFPKRVWISVSALTERPVVQAPTLTEGIYDATLTCSAKTLCINEPNLHWEWTKVDGQSMVLYGLPPNHRNFGRQRGRTISNLRLSPTADDHNTTITCVADYGHDVVKTTVTLTVKFRPRILNGRCTVEGKLIVCVCISRGNPLPPITWPRASLTDFSVSSYSSSHTVESTITMLAADYNTTKCVSSNEVGRAEIEIQFQNYTENTRRNYSPDRRQTLDGALPWIISGVSFSMNLVLLISLICTFKWGKRTQKTVCEEMKDYATLRTADLEHEYSVISPQPRYQDE